jgi:DNA-binding XRE family transcriptional regulator
MARKRPDSADIEIGRRIRALRLARGLSQAVLGHQIGVTFQQGPKV